MNNNVVHGHLLADAPKLEEDDELKMFAKTMEEEDDNACVIVLFTTEDQSTTFKK